MKAALEGVPMKKPQQKSEESKFKWPESIGIERVLKPESEELVTHYRLNRQDYCNAAEEVGAPVFARIYVEELQRLMPNNVHAVDHIQAVTRLGNFADQNKLNRENKAVARLLKRDGINRKPGKRTRPGIAGLVENIAPILLYYGVPLRSGETSRLVEILRIIAEAIELEGDPRNEIRRLRNVDKQHTIRIKKAICEAVKNGLESLKVTTPP